MIDNMVGKIETLFRWKKNYNRAALNDPLLKKLFEGIHIMHEWYDFENLCWRVRDTDFFNNREILRANGREILKNTLTYMSPEERKIVKENHTWRWIFDQIEEEVIEEEENNPKQLLLHNFAPIYNIEWYIKQVGEHIESLIGKLSFNHKRKFEGIAREMLENQCFKTNTDPKEIRVPIYIDTWKEISPLSEQEFIKKVKESRWGKALSIRLKKFEGKLLPDINERVEEMKKTNKGDIK